MLKSLYAKNYALIDELHVEFEPGLNIITGETGAGKSIIIGALAAILGERLSRDVIRTDADKAVIECEFAIRPSEELAAFFDTFDLDANDEGILIRRELSANGRSRSFVNDTPVPLNVLAELGDLLVDLHGQHQHQLLLQTRRHIEYLDAFAHVSDLLKEVEASYNRLIELTSELEDLRAREAQIRQSREILQFQLNEINQIDPQPDEDEELEQQERILRHAELLYERTLSLFRRLYEEEGSVSEVLSSSEKMLAELAEIDPKFESLRQECENARITIDELAGTLQQYSSDVTFDPENLERIRVRLASLTGLKKKYGGTIAAILEHRNKAEQELLLIENLDDRIAELERQVEEERNILKNLCVRLSERRREAAGELEQAMAIELARLGMPKAKFSVAQQYKDATRNNFVRIEDRQVQVTPRGIDQIEFLISANPGEDLKPLTSVASGGEISRIMLALKSLLAEIDRVPVLIFDEIDIGISGRIAQAVGKSLRKLAQSHQLICITHLPQIASMAHHHYLVEKLGDAHQTRTMIRKLDDEERTRQVAQLIGGEKVTPAHLRSAQELISESERV